MASTAGEIYDQNGGDALAIAALYEQERHEHTVTTTLLDTARAALRTATAEMASLRAQLATVSDALYDVGEERDQLRATVTTGGPPPPTMPPGRWRNTNVGAPPSATQPPGDTHA